MLFVGVDWAEDHHDVCVMHEAGTVLDKRRVAHSVRGVGELHEMLSEFSEEDEPVAVGIEVDRGLVVSALVGAGYEVYAVNPLAASRYRERHGVSGAKSDPGDAKMLADLVRTDRHNHRVLGGDSELIDAIKVLARSHQSAIWSRQRQINSLRSALREFYPAALEAFGTGLSSSDALAVLAIAPTPELGRTLSRSKIASALRRGGRQRYVEARAEAIQSVLHDEYLAAGPVLSGAYGIITTSSVEIIGALNHEVEVLEEALAEHFETHPTAKIVLSLPGLGTTLGGRVLGEFGDDPNRYSDSKSRKNYAGTSPITKASGKSHVVLARFARNQRLGDATEQWAFCSLTHSDGARAYYDALRSRGKTHRKALRQLANRWVGILHGCLESGTLYEEAIAWTATRDAAA
ncbi:MAG TPA: IS110 family transposase [Solirubrobacteraceae bacterium]|nr:IS110 family transposase [Solirubrobacteraceae bacterium]